MKEYLKWFSFLIIFYAFVCFLYPFNVLNKNQSNSSTLVLLVINKDRSIPYDNFLFIEIYNKSISKRVPVINGKAVFENFSEGIYNVSILWRPFERSTLDTINFTLNCNIKNFSEIVAPTMNKKIYLRGILQNEKIPNLNFTLLGQVYSSIEWKNITFTVSASPINITLPISLSWKADVVYSFLGKPLIVGFKEFSNESEENINITIINVADFSVKLSKPVPNLLLNLTYEGSPILEYCSDNFGNLTIRNNFANIKWLPISYYSEKNLSLNQVEYKFKYYFEGKTYDGKDVNITNRSIKFEVEKIQKATFLFLDYNGSNISLSNIILSLNGENKNQTTFWIGEGNYKVSVYLRLGGNDILINESEVNVSHDTNVYKINCNIQNVTLRSTTSYSEDIYLLGFIRPNTVINLTFQLSPFKNYYVVLPGNGVYFLISNNQTVLSIFKCPVQEVIEIPKNLRIQPSSFTIAVEGNSELYGVLSVLICLLTVSIDAIVIFYVFVRKREENE